MREYLNRAGYNETAVDRTIHTVIEADLGARGRKVSDEAACVSDADSLFKVLPITPILLARAYLQENNVSLYSLAASIVKEQVSRFENGYFFYTTEAKSRYTEMARQNLRMWQNVLVSLEEGEVARLAEEVMAQSADFGGKGI